MTTMSKRITQASNLKENLENQGIPCNNSTIASTDAEDFYPLVRLKQVRKQSSTSPRTYQKKIKSTLNTA